MIIFLLGALLGGSLVILIPRLIYIFIWSLLYISLGRPILSMAVAILVGLLFDLFRVLPIGQMALFFLCTVGFFELYATVFHSKNLLFMNIYALVFSILGYMILEERINLLFFVGYSVVALLMTSLVARRVVRTV